MRSTFHLEIPAFCSIPLRLAVYESKTALCVNSLRLLLSFMCSKGRKVILGGQRQNNLEIKASSCHLLFSFPSFLPLMVHALCLRFHLLSSSLLSLFLLSLSAADVLVMLFCIFSPAACAGYPVWSNIPGGDLSKLPGKFVIFILNVTIFFPVVFLLLWWWWCFLLWWFVRTQEHYVCANVPTLCDIRMKFFRGSE